MKKIFISADIEGTCGIVNWNETEKNHPDYAVFADRMTREVAAACEGAHKAGAQSVLVKDAHDSARNLDAAALPEYAQVFRGWGRDPLIMMAGLDECFSGVFLTGYHSGASMGGNPLAHTMDTKITRVLINGDTCTEMMISAYAAAMMNVPLLLVTGDQTLCDEVKRLSPHTQTVAVSYGFGAGSVAMHPLQAQKAISAAAEMAMKLDPKDCVVKLPESFHIEVYYNEHTRAKNNGFFPGAKQTGPHTVTFDCTDFYEALRFFHFCL